MYKIRVWAPTLACWMAISFTICVVGGLLLPSAPIPHKSLELLFPGFVWISVSSFLLGLVESVVFGLYGAVLFVPLHNFFARRLGLSP